MKYKLLSSDSTYTLENDLNDFASGNVVIRKLHYSVTDEFFSVLIEYESMS